MAFSKVFEAVEENRRKILADANDALDVMKVLKEKPSSDSGKGELFAQVEEKLKNILNTVSR